MYQLLDWFFTGFHSILILFNLTGWIWKNTRRLHLYLICLTFLSWFGLGIFFGWGYCPCTDWHWQVKATLGEKDLPASYVKYYADLITGKDWDSTLVDIIVISAALIALILSLWKNSSTKKELYIKRRL